MAHSVAYAIALAASITCTDGVGPARHAGFTEPPPTAALTATALIASDDFERLQLGPNWLVGTTSAAGIIGGRDLGAVKFGPVNASWVANQFGADQFSEIKIASGDDPNMLLQVHVRRQLISSARYGFHYNLEKNPPVWEIKYDGVPLADTRILASATGTAPVAGNVIRIEARGREISGYLNGQRLLVATDNAPNAILTTGLVGVTSRPRVTATVRFPVPLVAAWRGGNLQVTSTCGATLDTAKVPLNDLGAGCYLGYQGGLYPGGANSPPATHAAAGTAAAAQIAPLDVNGQPSANGRYVMLSIGMSNTTQEFCDDDGNSKVCERTSFMGQAAADPAVNRSTLAIVNGAFSGRDATFWVSPTSAEYDRIRDNWLTPLGLSEKQVQIAWVKVADLLPTTRLPSPDADAFVLERELGQINRALKARYPNLRQIFVSSRIYGGFSQIPVNPEPFAYESGLSVKWTIEAQLTQMATGVVNPLAGDLRYDTGAAAWMAWGPYTWSGTRARSDGLVWVRTDFADDGLHPASSGRMKVGTMLLNFFKTSPLTSCWFLAGQSCRT